MSIISTPSIQQQLDLLDPRAGAATASSFDHDTFDSPTMDVYEDMEDDAVESKPRVFPRRLDLHTASPIHMRAVSLPAPTPPRMTPDPSSSPAARFLSGFYSPASLSPAASPQVLPPVEPEPDAEGLEIAGFVLGRELGRGGFSLIRQATNQNTGAVVAVKVVRQPEPNAEHAEHRRAQLQRETDIWRQLSHEHVLPLFSAHTTFRATYFITQYCPAGTLYDILRKDGRPTMDDAGMMFRQVVRGLRYLHEIARVVHGDMKLENVLVDEFGTCKISDFGMARAFDEVDADPTGDSALDSSSSDDAEPMQTSHSRRQTLPGLTVHLSLMRSGRRNRPSMPSSSMSQGQLAQARQHVQPGSLPYAAPELLMPVTRRRKAGHSGPGQDVWAVGVMLYVLLTGVFPFADTFEPRVRRKILAGTYETPAGIGKAATAVLSGCLQLDLRDRWTARVVDEAAWTVGWADVANEDDDTPQAQSQPQPQPSTSNNNSGGRSVSRARPGLTSRSRSRAAPATNGVGPIRTSRSGSAVRPNGGRSTSRCSGSELAVSMELPALTLSPPTTTERRGRTRHRDLPADEEAEVSRSPSGPTTPPDDVSPQGMFGGARVSASTSESSVSSGERRRVTFPDEDWKTAA